MPAIIFDHEDFAELDQSNLASVVSGAQKFIIPVAEMEGEPLIYPEGHEKAGKPVVDWQGNPIGKQGIVFYNLTDNSVQAVPSDGNGVIIINQVTEDQAKQLLDSCNNEPPKTLAQIKELLAKAETLGLKDMYNSDKDFINSKMSKMPSNKLEEECFGLHKRDDRDICQAFYVEGEGKFQGSAQVGQQHFANGAVILKQGKEVRLIQPDVFTESYLKLDGSKVTAKELPRLAMAELQSARKQAKFKSASSQAASAVAPLQAQPKAGGRAL